MERNAVMNSENNKVTDGLGRMVYLDALRTLACFAVVMLHVTALNTYNVDFKSHEWNIFMLYESIVNWAVPVFVMVSGAVMLRKEYDYKAILLKLKIYLFFFLVWSIIYLLFDFIIFGIKPYENMLWLQVILQGHYHMWFLIMLVGLYLITPFVKVIIEKPILRKAFIYLTALFTFVLPSLRNISLLIDINKILYHPLIGSLYRACFNIYDDLNYHFTVGFVGYFVIGYVLANCFDFERCKLLKISLGLVLIGSIITFSEIRLAISKEAAGIFMLYYQIGILMQALGLFLSSVCLADSCIIKNLAKLSPLSLGIYMLHPMIIEVFKKMEYTSLNFNPLISVPIITIEVFIIAGLFVKLLMMTPLKALVKIGRR